MTPSIRASALALSLFAIAGSAAVAAPAATKPATAAKPLMTPAQRAIADSWGDHGVWRSTQGFWFTGFKNEAAYLDPKNPEPIPAPLNAQARAYRTHVREELGKGRVIYNPTSQCFPFGVPYLIAASIPFEFQFSNNRAMMLYENSEYRIVYLDGRQHPTEDEWVPTYHGHSVGHWEGDTLVIDTVGIKGEHMQIEPHIPFTDKMHVIERYTPNGKDSIKVQVTMIDPGTLTAPWKATVEMKRTADWTLSETNCVENNHTKVDSTGALYEDAPGVK